MKQKSCVVIGAGLAGLSAAYHLVQKNCAVKVFEATDRIGGRVMTYKFPKAPELNCELGGEWIGDDHQEMQGLCKKLGLNLQKHQYANSFWDQIHTARLLAPGKWCMSRKSERIWKRFQKEFKKYKKNDMEHLDTIDWWTTLVQRGFDPEDLRRRDLMDSTDFGETIRMNSGYTAATEYLSTPDQKVDDTDEMDYKVEGGNHLLVDALADHIGRVNIRKKAEVHKILQKNGKVTVHFKDKSIPSATADFCICATPAHALARIDWGKHPPREKIAAAWQLQYARITKTAVLCSHRFWPQPKKGGFSVFTNLASDYCFDSTQSQAGDRGILCSYAVGDKADDIASSPTQKLKYWIVEDVAHAFGMSGWTARDSQLTALDIKQQPWQKDQLIGGAYAFYRPGQWFTVQPALLKPFQRVFFAGEHIAEWQGFMEGAVVTGKDAARDVLDS